MNQNPDELKNLSQKDPLARSAETPLPDDFWSGSKISILTVLAYFFGGRKAILQIATTPGATWLGLLFVLSAGFAREYDVEDLLARPWYLLLPVGVSLALSLALFCLVMPLARLKGARQGTFWGNYRMFLRLFWMTAPIAWIYAIPVQEFLGAADATGANLWMLGIVSSWRVILMIRVLSVLFDANPFSTGMPVLLFADTITLVALKIAPLPVFSIMGGIRLTESEDIIQSTAFFVGFFGVISWLIWLIGTCIVAGLRKSKWHLAVSSDGPAGTVSRGLWALAACSIIVWALVLPRTQPKQQLRNQVERLLRNGQPSAAIALMSKHESADFPRHWDPPPRIGYGEKEPPLLDVLEVIRDTNAPAWVQTIYLDKLSIVVGDDMYSILYGLDSDELDRYLAIFETLPQSLDIVRNNPGSLRAIFHYREDCTDERKKQIQAILAAAGHSTEYAPTPRTQDQESPPPEDILP